MWHPPGPWPPLVLTRHWEGERRGGQSQAWGAQSRPGPGLSIRAAVGGVEPGCELGDRPAVSSRQV